MLATPSTGVWLCGETTSEGEGHSLSAAEGCGKGGGDSEWRECGRHYSIKRVKVPTHFGKDNITTYHSYLLALLVLNFSDFSDLTYPAHVAQKSTPPNCLYKNHEGIEIWTFKVKKHTLGNHNSNESAR